MDARAVREQAEAEVRREEFRRAVDAEKLRLLQRKPWWHSLLPFKITITRR
ncbi:hypothetical protein [Paraburkholderia silvatlantica]|uniref:Uncharacterized protein n=1 Tax=Paraburkholderia silvatlantica TaxID=321895 RepID=A0ABR6FLS2_9BURK|nr:hypothetical protein [Paraburkholderia silvatlantica]MBB2928377.1 hypothetical protein [Paraburkholderia silvatlantica]